ncbi:MAG TPA: CHRD domain-containing protein, partial [Vicinamibacterales bacterium]|nr:CHRD domain-containing protein [Vicinamibacterales bacterium]
MRKTSSLLLAVLVAGCTPDQDGTTMDASQLTAPLFEVRGDHFRTHATGSEEVPANSSRAQGQAMFHLSGDGTTLSYKLIVANIQNVTQSHIHLAPAGSNGG